MATDLLQRVTPARSRFLRSRAWLGAVGTALLLIVMTATVPVSRVAILRATGHLLVVDPPLPKSTDIIVVAIDADGAGALEAADLVHRGLANRVAVFADPPGPVDREFLRRGLPYEDAAAISIRELQSLGVQNTEQISRTVTGSTQESDLLPEWCVRHGYRSAILVTTWDHSRRLSRLFRRSMRGEPVQIIVRPSPYSPFNPDRWWHTRAGVRLGIFEFEKLVLDVAAHPLY